MQKFPIEKIDEIIELVKNRPALYDGNIKLTRYPENSRDSYWREVSKLSGLSVDDCKSLWLTLRDLYQKNVRKNLCYPPSQRKPHRFEKQLSFLKKYLRLSKHVPNFEAVVIEDDLSSENWQNEEEESESLLAPPSVQPVKRSRSLTPSPDRELNEAEEEQDHNSNDASAVSPIKKQRVAQIHDDPLGLYGFFNSMATTLYNFVKAENVPCIDLLEMQHSIHLSCVQQLTQWKKKKEEPYSN